MLLNRDSDVVIGSRSLYASVARADIWDEGD